MVNIKQLYIRNNWYAFCQWAAAQDWPLHIFDNQNLACKSWALALSELIEVFWDKYYLQDPSEVWPSDIWQHVMSFLVLVDVLNVMGVCKHLRDQARIATSSVLIHKACNFLCHSWHLSALQETIVCTCDHKNNKPGNSLCSQIAQRPNHRLIHSLCINLPSVHMLW